MNIEPYKFNQTWQDKVHPHSVNYPKDLWELICGDAKRLHTSRGHIIRDRLRESYCKDRLPIKQELKDYEVEYEKPKRYQGFIGNLRRNLGALIKHRRLRELERTKKMLDKVFEQE